MFEQNYCKACQFHVCFLLSFHIVGPQNQSTRMKSFLMYSDVVGVPVKYVDLGAAAAKTDIL